MKTITRELTIVATYRVVEHVSDDAPTSLPPGSTAYTCETSGEDITHVRGPSVVKCRALPQRSRKAG